MSLKDKLDEIISAERYGAGKRDSLNSGSHRFTRDRLGEIRSLLTEFAEAVDDEYVSISVTNSRAVIDVGDMRSDKDRFEIDCRWELEPRLQERSLSEAGARLVPPKCGFVVWKTRYLRPLMDPDYLSWDRLEFDSGAEAFDHVFQDVARQIARQLRLRQRHDSGHEPTAGRS